MMRKSAGALIFLTLCICPVLGAQPEESYTFVFRPPVGRKLEYRLTTSGLGDVAVLGSDLGVSGKLAFSVEAVGVHEDGTVTLDTTLHSGSVRVGQVPRKGLDPALIATWEESVRTGTMTEEEFHKRVYDDATGLPLPVDTVGQTARVRVDSHGHPIEVIQPLKAMWPGIIDLGTVLLYLQMGMILPEEPVHVGDIWSADHQAVRYDGKPISFSGRNELKEVNEVNGRRVAVIFSKLICPVQVEVTGYDIQGTFYTDMTSEIFMDTGELYHRASQTRAVLLAQGQEVYNLEATLHHLKTDCSLIEASAVSMTGGTGSLLPVLLP